MGAWRCATCQGENPAGTRFCGSCGAPAGASGDGVAGGPGDDAERRLVTVVFADLSGFTTLADRQDAESVADIVDPMLQALAEIVERHGGYVDKFAGDAVMALFGAPVASGDDADAAVRAALEMHEHVAGAPGGAGLQLHVGINSGHVVARTLRTRGRADYSVVGDAVNVAQRLESVARSGETVLGGTTRRLLRGTYELEDLGPLELKGKRSAVQAWRLLAGHPAPVSTRDVPVVGRERDLERVLAALDDRGAIVEVTGELGIGKSTLLAEVLGRLAVGRRRTVLLRGRREGQGVAYRPLADAAAADGGPLAVAVLAALRAEDGVVPEAARRRLRAAARRWLVGDDAVVVVDDAQWLDAATAGLLGELAGDVRLLLAGRTLEPLEPWLAPHPSTSLTLPPLDAPATARLVTELLGPAAAAPTTATIVEHAAGNPLHAIELARHHASRRSAPPRAGAVARPEVPPSLEAALSARIDRASPLAADVLRAVSVLGASATPAAVAAVLGVADLTVAQRELATAELADLGPGARFEVHHPLVQAVVYDRLLQRQRRRLHEAAADALTALHGVTDATVDELARHRRLAGDAVAAIPLLRRAARRAASLHANHEAIEHLRAAVELAGPDPAQAGPLLLELADLLTLVGAFDDAGAAYARARDAHPDARAWAGMAGALRRQGRFEDAIDVLDTAERLAVGDRRHLWLERSWACSFADDLEASIRAADQGLAADAGTEDGLTASLRLRLAYALAETGAADRAVEHAIAAAELFERLEDRSGVATALLTLGGCYEALGDLERAATTLRRGITVSERIGSVEDLGGCLVNLGLVEQERGELASGIACDERALAEFERAGHVAGVVNAASNLGEKLLLVGRVAEARRRCEQALALATEIGFGLAVAANTETLAQVALADGDPAVAADLAERAARMHAADGFRVMEAEAWSTAARAWALVDDEDRRVRAEAAAARAAALDPVPGRPAT